MHNLLVNPDVIRTADAQRQIVEAFAPSLDTPLIDHMRALLDTVSTGQEPEIESMAEYFRRNFNMGA